MRNPNGLLRYLLGLAPLLPFYLWLHLEYPAYFDDSFIGFRISRNLAEGHWLVYNAGDLALTNTSFLYPLLNGALMYVLGPDRGLHAAIGLDVIWHILTLGLLAVMLERAFPALAEAWPRWFRRATLAGLYLISLRVLPLVPAGMESQLYLLVIVASLYFYQGRQMRLAFAVAALAFWVRPEGLLAPLALGAAYLLERRRVPFDLIAIVATIWGILLLYNHTVYESWLPLSITAKQRSAAYTPALRYALWDLMTAQPFHTPLYAWAMLALAFIGGLAKKALRPAFFWWLLYTLFFSFVANWFFGWYRTAFLVGYFYFPLAAVAYGVERWLAAGKPRLALSALAAFGLLWGAAGISLALYYRGQMPRLSRSYRIRERQAQQAYVLLSGYDTRRGSILLEPLGVIGYHFPGWRFADFPGLCSPQVLAAHKALGRPLVDNWLGADTAAFHNLIRRVDLPYIIATENDIAPLTQSRLLEEYRLLGATDYNPQPNFRYESMFNPKRLYVYVKKGVQPRP